MTNRIRHNIGSILDLGNITEDSDLGDFTLWGPAAQLIILGLMVVGGSIGSTAGGLKVSRAVILVKAAAAQIRRSVRPAVVTVVRMDRRPVATSVVVDVMSFFFMEPTHSMKNLSLQGNTVVMVVQQPPKDQKHGHGFLGFSDFSPSAEEESKRQNQTIIRDGICRLFLFSRPMLRI